MNQATDSIQTDVCIVGGGPAGLICGLLLARQGVKTLVLESHPDFEREYRGEVLMPRFIQAMKQIGLWDYLQGFPHLKLEGFELYLKSRPVATIKIPEIAPEAPFILWMPQPVMLRALHEKAKTYPSFDLWFDARAAELLHEGKKVVGTKALHHGKPVEIHAQVTLGADGRFSTIRREGGFELAYDDHDFDILWFTIPKPKGYNNTVRAFFSGRHNYLALPKYPEHVQCGILIEAGSYGRLRQQGIEPLRCELLSAHPMLSDFAMGLRDFSPFTLLAAKADRVKEWAKDGLLLIGDAAHTCSPAGAIGVSVAVETAIVAASVVAGAIKAQDVSLERLGKVQVLREKKVKEIQNIQNQAATLVSARNPVFKWFAFSVFFLLAKTRLFARLQRRLLVAPGPLPVGDLK